MKKVSKVEEDIAELARAINLQAKLLNEMVRACKHVCDTYAALISVGGTNEKVEEPKPNTNA